MTHTDDSVKQPKNERYGKSNMIKKEMRSCGDREERERTTGIKQTRKNTPTDRVGPSRRARVNSTEPSSRHCSVLRRFASHHYLITNNCIALED